MGKTKSRDNTKKLNGIGPLVRVIETGHPGEWIVEYDAERRGVVFVAHDDEKGRECWWYAPAGGETCPRSFASFEFAAGGLMLHYGIMPDGFND